MGGSRLAADILNIIRPDLEIHIHSDFDLPKLDSQSLYESLIIANSFSGDTAEIISGAKEALKHNYNLAVICSGGELKEISEQNELPHILNPNGDGLPARMMIGHDLLAIAAMIGLSSGLFKACADLAPEGLKAQGSGIAQSIGSKIPLIYTSQRLNELGYIWKVIFNETAKIPAFHNRFPEADHNEVSGFHFNHDEFAAIFIRDDLDDRISQRMDAMAKILESKNISAHHVQMSGQSLLDQVMSSIITAHWAAFEIAGKAGIDPISAPEIKDLKDQLS